MKLNTIFILLLLIFKLSTIHAANFCVSTSAEFEAALDTAASNSQSDVIKLNPGVYIPTLSGFDYFAQDEPYDLEISGGWTFFFGVPCSLQSATSPEDTRLDGFNNRQILNMDLADNINVTISNFQFQSGLSAGFGGALAIYSDENSKVKIESNIFNNNTALGGSALVISNGKVIVKNNLFYNNHATDGSAFHYFLGGSSSEGIYFTNNTVMSNTSGTGDCAGVTINVLNDGQAFIANNVLWGNQTSDLNLNGFGVNYILNNDIGLRIGTVWYEENTISVPPQFTPGPLGSTIYTPLAGSPLINAGIKPPQFISIPPNFDQTWTLGDSDIIGNPRIQSSQVDIGAYESIYNSGPIFDDSFENL